MPQKSRYNINAFDSISNESAYWLGILMSDGCLYKGDTRHMVILSLCDYEIVEGFKNFMCVKDIPKIKKSIHPISGKEIYTLGLCNRHLFYRLTKLGCGQNKTFSLEWPQIEEKYLWAFIRGFFDGDGSISLNRSINQWKVSIGCASKSFIDSFCEFVAKHNLLFSTDIRTLKSGHGFYNIQFFSASLRKIYEYLYKDNGPKLLRKYTKFTEAVSSTPRNPRYQNWEIDLMNSFGVNSVDMINSHPKNLGWKRTVAGIDRFIRNNKELFDART